MNLMQEILDEARGNIPKGYIYGHAGRDVEGVGRVSVRVEIIMSRGSGRNKPHLRAIWRIDGQPASKAKVAEALKGRGA